MERITTCKVSVDVDGRVTVSELFEKLEQSGVTKIMGFQAKGPGGGNPALVIGFATPDEAFKFSCEFWGINPDEDADTYDYAMSLVEPV